MRNFPYLLFMMMNVLLTFSFESLPRRRIIYPSQVTDVSGTIKAFCKICGSQGRDQILFQNAKVTVLNIIGHRVFF